MILDNMTMADLEPYSVLKGKELSVAATVRFAIFNKLTWLESKEWMARDDQDWDRAAAFSKAIANCKKVMDAIDAESEFDAEPDRKFNY